MPNPFLQNKFFAVVSFFGKLCMLVILLSLVFACSGDPEDTRILEAAQEYAKTNSDIEVNVELEEVVDEYARVHVSPADPGQADEAIMYLKKTNGRWEGLAIGTSFSPDDYQSLNIPEKIR
jgi:hypothetical protein